jgi:hypothetical protein
MSPRRPNRSDSPAAGRAKAVATQGNSARSRPTARPTSGSAMLRMEKSTESMKLVPRRSTAVSRCRAVIATVAFARASMKLSSPSVDLLNSCVFNAAGRAFAAPSGGRQRCSLSSPGEVRARYRSGGDAVRRPKPIVVARRGRKCLLGHNLLLLRGRRPARYRASLQPVLNEGWLRLNIRRLPTFNKSQCPTCRKGPFVSQHGDRVPTASATERD